VWSFGNQCCAACNGGKDVSAWHTNLPYRLLGKFSFHGSIRTWLGLVLHWERNWDVCTSIDADHIAQMVDKLTTAIFQQAMKEFPAALVVNVWMLNYGGTIWLWSPSHSLQEDNVMDHRIYTYMGSNCHSSSGTIKLTTPDGVPYTPTRTPPWFPGRQLRSKKHIPTLQSGFTGPKYEKTKRYLKEECGLNRYLQNSIRTQ